MGRAATYIAPNPYVKGRFAAKYCLSSGRIADRSWRRSRPTLRVRTGRVERPIGQSGAGKARQGPSRLFYAQRRERRHRSRLDRIRPSARYRLLGVSSLGCVAPTTTTLNPCLEGSGSLDLLGTSGARDSVEVAREWILASEEGPRSNSEGSTGGARALATAERH